MSGLLVAGNDEDKDKDVADRRENERHRAEEE